MAITSRIFRLSTRSPTSLHPHRTLTTTHPRRLASGDLGNPPSSSRDEASLSQNRATEDTPSPDTASVQQPVSNRSAIPGEKDEGTPTEEAVRGRPEEPAEQKRERVERQGEKGLGVEDEQK